jgi:phosphotriesterase-related protein
VTAEPTVETVRGTVAVSALGRTLMHEHLFVLSPELADYPDICWGGDPEQARIEQAVAKLTALKQRGFDTIVDLTVLGCGRSIPRVITVNERVDMNIVVAAGLFTLDPLPRFVTNRPPCGGTDVLTELFTRDLGLGIGSTGVRAAVLKCCTDTPGVTPNVDRVLRATARAQLGTGALICTHTDAASRTGLDQQRIFATEGVDLRRVIVGHSGDSTDLPYLRTLMEAGSTIGCDRFGLYQPGWPGLDERVEVVARLCAEDYASQIVLSHDANCHSDWHDTAALAVQPDWVYTHIADEVLPSLRRRGVTEAQIDQMLVGNPARLLPSTTSQA